MIGTVNFFLALSFQVTKDGLTLTCCNQQIATETLVLVLGYFSCDLTVNSCIALIIKWSVCKMVLE